MVVSLCYPIVHHIEEEDVIFFFIKCLFLWPADGVFEVGSSKRHSYD